MTLRRLALALLLLLATACGGGGKTIEQDAGNVDVSDSVTADAAPIDVVDILRIDLHTKDAAPFDGGSDWGQDNATGCQPGDGCFGDPCQENSQCLSGWCVDHMGQSVCSDHCVEECPPGWTCKTVSDGGPDVVSICVSDMANLCKPCATSEGCQTVAGADGACLDYGDEGSFCGGTCEVDDDCPWGFVCSAVTTVEGVELTQCQSESGTCPCTDQAVELGLTTPCKNTNEWGTCEGKRTCTEDGLSDCDAPVPAQETCNGLDDDCDGDVDEALFVEGDYVNLCDDGDDCTDDVCQGETGCANAALSGTECSDDNPCTVVDLCQDGICVGQPVDCDDDNPCTDDACAPDGGCQHVSNTLPCDDEDVCTVGDHCAQGQCLGQPVSCDCLADEDCAGLEDGDLCNGTLYCNLDTYPYKCEVVADSKVDCPQAAGHDAPCLEPVCDAETGECSFAPANDGAPCSDGDACTAGDVCQAGSCMPGAPANCNDGNPCTDDACDPATGCTHVNNVLPCTDGSVCTVGDLCVDGGCAPGAALDCDDGNICTDDTCDADVGCVHMANQADCDDGNACTTGDVCAAGQCHGAGWLPCNDGNICTDDSCDSQTGCVHAANQAPCTDNNACTNGDTCADGACLPGATITCNDGNLCTDDSCDAEVGCLFVTNQAPCDDGNACTTGDVCANGACTFLAGLECDDDNICTDDACDTKLGCVFTANVLPCSDGSACSVEDQCAAGICQPGTPLDCDDGNVCTDDSCDADLGCQAVPNQEMCAAPVCQNGVYLAASTCAAGVCPQQQATACEFLCGDEGCFGECLPEALQCNGLTIQLCDEAGTWQDQETCPKGCFEGICTDPEGPIQEGIAANPNLFVDENGQFVVIFNESDTDFSNVRMATFNGAWQSETIFEGYSIGAQAADRDANGTYHLIMGKFGEASVNYGTGPGPWAIDSVLLGIPTGGPTGKLDSDGHFHISSSTSLKDRYYATNKTGNWASSKVSSSSTGIASIAINGNNPPSLVYNHWSTRRIYVAQGPNFESGQTLLESYGVDQGPPLSLKYFGNKRHLVYAYTHDYYTHYNVKYRTDETGSWSTTTLVQSGPGVSGLDLTMDPAGKAHVVNCNQDKDMLYHSNRSGAWQSATILDGSCGGGNLDTVFYNNKLYVVYRDLGYLLTLLEIDPSILEP